MKRRWVLALLLLAGCGGGGGGGSAAAPVGGGEGETPWPSYSVASSSDLPSCPATGITGRIYYVEDVSAMKACTSTGWSVINLGTYIVSNRKIGTGGANYCTEFASEACYFGGGQIIKYSDGSIFINGNFSFIYFVAGDTDTNFSSNSLIVAPTSSEANLSMSSFVARGTGYKSLWLAYDRATDTVELVYDTSSDGVMGTGDTVIQTLTVSSW